jgi:hypothetical protein
VSWQNERGKVGVTGGATGGSSELGMKRRILTGGGGGGDRLVI